MCVCVCVSVCVCVQCKCVCVCVCVLCVGSVSSCLSFMNLESDREAVGSE